MSSKATAWALEQVTERATDKLVLIGLAQHADPKSNLCYPKRATLAEYAMCSLDSVDRAIKRLEARGFVRKRPQIERDGEIEGDRRHSNTGRQTTNCYELLVPNFERPQPHGAAPPAADRCGPPSRTMVRPLEYLSETKNLKEDISIGSSAATPDDPRLAARGDDMPPHVQPVRTWSETMSGMRQDPIRLDGDQVVLDEATRTLWLDRFDGDAKALDLALVEARGRIQPNSRAYSIAVQVGRALARIASERHNRKANYREGAASRQEARSSKRTLVDVLRERGIMEAAR